MDLFALLCFSLLVSRVNSVSYFVAEIVHDGRGPPVEAEQVSVVTTADFPTVGRPGA